MALLIKLSPIGQAVVRYLIAVWLPTREGNGTNQALSPDSQIKPRQASRGGNVSSKISVQVVLDSEHLSHLNGFFGGMVKKMSIRQCTDIMGGQTHDTWAELEKVTLAPVKDYANALYEVRILIETAETAKKFGVTGEYEKLLEILGLKAVA